MGSLGLILPRQLFCIGTSDITHMFPACKQDRSLVHLVIKSVWRLSGLSKLTCIGSSSLVWRSSTQDIARITGTFNIQSVA